MPRHRLILPACLLPTLALAVPAWAHGGGLDKNGCHRDHRNGGYHCHRGQSPSQPPALRPVRPPEPRYLAPGQGLYRNCDEARAAGAAPIRRGQPGYAAHLDRDGDGIACEPRPAR